MVAAIPQILEEMGVDPTATKKTPLP